MLAWATTLQKDARPLLADAEHSVECDEVSSVVLLGPHHTLGMRNLRVVQLQRHRISGPKLLEHARIINVLKHYGETRS